MDSTSEALVSTKVCSGAHSGAMRSIASQRSGCSLASGSSCLGRIAVLTGQNRDPTPPARITLHTSPDSLLAFGLWPPSLTRRPAERQRLLRLIQRFDAAGASD